MVSVAVFQAFFLAATIGSAAHGQPLSGVLDGIQKTLMFDHDPIKHDQKLSSTPHESLKVIGAGLPRTGTGSLHAALELLGHRNCHMVNVMQSSRHAALWGDVARNNVSVNEVWETIAAEGFNATLDYPASDYFVQAWKQNPDAKVILSVRDNAKVWANSFRTLIRKVRTADAPLTWSYPNFLRAFWPKWADDLHQMRCALGTHSLGWEPCAVFHGNAPISTVWLEEQYERQIELSKTNIPPEKLLIFNVKQGWEPLCSFLEVPVPEGVPFPRMGESALLKRITFTLQLVTYLWIPILLLIMWFIARPWKARSNLSKDKTV